MVRGLELPSLIFLFGLAGAGKNFCADAVAEALGYKIYDLDIDLTPAMRTAITEQRPFTDQMRDEFFEEVCTILSALKRKHPKLIVTQGAYKERHRALVSLEHPEVNFIWIDAPTEIILQRLTARGDTVSPEYATAIARNFEPPTNGLKVINDDIGKEEIVQRFKVALQRD